ncbi:MAG: hypothetical protein OES69_16825 [Myxococcales bacterium]|nr:hypothetical protein [Myxococcales bacterium]MDH3845604.1 hypothetical protein [Myxococcales bacterium]
MSLLRTGLSLLWEAPQTALGVAILGVEAACKRIRNIEVVNGRMVVESRGTGISLGHVVFWSRESSRWHELDDRNRAHELGHTKQSRLFGPLYLPIIGVPSISRAIYALAYREITGREWTRYYDGYPEKWADRLGGVVRDEERA